MTKAWREHDHFDDELEVLEKMQTAARNNGPEVEDPPQSWWRQAWEWFKGFWI